MNDQIPVKHIMGEVFNQIADAIENGKFDRKIKIGLTTLGCEVGIDQWIGAAEDLTMSSDEFEVVLIGHRLSTKLVQFEIQSEDEMHRKMETMLDYGMIDACITTHYTYPIGVASVGKMTSPGNGRDYFLATTSGTAHLSTSVAMVKNAMFGIIVAKTMGVQHPRVGILNVAGARQTEKALVRLNDNGYPIHFAQSMRDESGCIMRGNDVIAGSTDVLVQDSLTGNILMKMGATFMTAGNYEAMGAGYGPGIGENYDRLALVISRASGYSVVQHALTYAVQLVKGGLRQVARRELQLAHGAGLKIILDEMIQDDAKQAKSRVESVGVPLGEPVSGGISGIDIMEIEDAMKRVWMAGIYAESGMGCTGPVLLVNEKRLEKAMAILRKEGYLVYEEMECV